MRNWGVNIAYIMISTQLVGSAVAYLSSSKAITRCLGSPSSSTAIWGQRFSTDGHGTGRTPDRVEISDYSIGGGLVKAEVHNASIRSKYHTPSVRESFTSTPKLVTFDATGTVMELTSGVGTFYREVLMEMTDYNARLPRPGVFAESFFKAYKGVEEEDGCFGKETGMGEEEWWRKVVMETYAGVKELDNQEGLREELGEGLGEACFQKLYNEVFSGGEGWKLKEGASDFLEEIKEWKKEGLKVGCISNFDSRLGRILSDIGISGYFDFVLTSGEVGNRKPDEEIFKRAMEEAGVTDPANCVHVGDSLAKDVDGAKGAGWHPIFIPNDISATVSSPDSDVVGEGNGEGYTQVGDLWGVLGVFGREKSGRVIVTTRPILEEGNDAFAEWEYEK